MNTAADKKTGTGFVSSGTPPIHPPTPVQEISADTFGKSFQSGEKIMTAKKVKLKVDPRAIELKELREQLAELKKTADALKADLLKEYGLGAHPGFTFIDKPKFLLNNALLEAKLGSLEPYKKLTPAIHIEFPENAA